MGLWKDRLKFLRLKREGLRHIQRELEELGYLEKAMEIEEMIDDVTQEIYSIREEDDDKDLQ